MHPVLELRVAHASVEAVRGEHEHEVARVAHAVQQVIVELPRPQLLYIQEDSEAPQLQVHLQQAAREVVRL